MAKANWATSDTVDADAMNALGAAANYLSSGGYLTGNYYMCNSVEAAGTAAPPNSTARATAWLVTASVSITRIGAEFTVAGNAGAVFRLGIWNDNGSSQPGTLLLDAGTVAVDGTPGWVEATVSQTISPGLYWVGGAVQSAATTAPTMRTVTRGPIPQIPLGTSTPGAGVAQLGYTQSSVTGALGTWSGTFATFNVPRIGFKVA